MQSRNIRTATRYRLTAQQKDRFISFAPGRKNIAMAFHHSGLGAYRSENEQGKAKQATPQAQKAIRKRAKRRVCSGHRPRVARFLACKCRQGRHLPRTAQNDTIL